MKGGKPECTLDKIYELGGFMTSPPQFLIFCKIKHSHYRGWEAKQNRIKFFPNITKLGLHFNNWQPLELHFGGFSAACRSMGYLSVHFQLQCEMKQVQRPMQEIPGEGRECCTEHSLLCHSMKEAVHWHTPGKSWETKCLFSFI